MTYIVHFGKYYPPYMGGIESVTQTLAESAISAGYKVLVICFNKFTVGSSPDSFVPVHRCPINKMINGQPMSWSYFLEGLHEGRRADIIHLHAPNLLAALASLFIGGKPKLIVHWHSDVIDKGWLGKLVRPLEYLMLIKATAIIATSQRYAEGSKTLKPFLNKVFVVPLGITPPAIPDKKPLLSQRLAEFVADRKLVLSVGRLAAYKGFSVLIEAAEFFSDGVAIVIAGEGVLSDNLAELINRRQVGKKVMLAGRVTQEELTALYAHADVFCLPSILRSEAFGVVLMEAMTYSLPIIATNIEGSGVPWVNAYDESGLNVQPGDPRALAAACTLIMNDTALRTRYARGAKERFKNNFTEKIFWKNINYVYRLILPIPSKR